MLRHLPLATFLAGVLLCTATASAADFALGSLTIESPWARPTDPMAKTGAAYFTVKNKGTADKLVGVSSGVADSAMLHHMVNKDGMMTMEHVGNITVPSGGSAVLKPGAYHVMFLGLKAPLKEGSTFPLELTFEKAGKVTVQVAVQRPDAAQAGKTQGHTGHGEAKKDGHHGMKH